MNPSSDARSQRLFIVETIGFADGERSLLSSTFRLTDRRQYSYTEDAARRTDLYLVNADSAEALEQLRIRGPNLFCPAVLIGQAAGLPWPQVQRPIAWTRLFDTLDMVMGIAAEKRNSRSQTPWDGSKRRRGDQAASEPSPAAPPRRESVLVVDDSATVRAFMRSRLMPFRFDVDFAASGETAIELAREKRYACIFLDILMPGMDGYETCRRLKSDARTKQTAVVMLSSKSGTLDKIRGNWSGCDAYLGKPVDENELLVTIARFLPSARRVVETMLGGG